MTERYAGGVALAEVTRSNFVEGFHRGSVVLLDGRGSVVTSAGDVTSAIFPRSANKPLQTIGMLRAGLRLADSADLALVCASHHGTDPHVDRVRAMLRSAGLDEDSLHCPPDLPLGDAAREALLRAGAGPARVRMNCSGKHAGMLLACRAAGWPIEGYWRPEHPLQQVLREAVEEFTGERTAAVGVDGCGAPVFSASLTGLAGAYLRLVSAPPDSPQRMVTDAMRAHPELVGGPTGAESRLMAGVPGLLMKPGAEGVLALALPGVGAAAIKIDDGAKRAWPPVAVAALRRLGVSEPVLEELAEVPLLGGGVPVGAVRALW